MKFLYSKTDKLVIAFLGALVYFYLFRLSIIDPGNLEWIFFYNGDLFQHFSGWQFFRNDEWRFPLGFFTNYNQPFGTSVVYMDAIPIMAIIFKILSPFLPEKFQYIGIYILICYILHALFAYKLMSKFINDKLILFYGVVVFCLSPVVLVRTYGHEALASHWLILAALYLYFSSGDPKIKSKWIFLISIASLIHVYLLLMVLAIWSVAVLDLLFKKNIK